MDSAKIIKEKKEQMIEWAKTRDNIIRYERVVDILCDKDDSVTEETIKHVIEDLTEQHIAVVRDTDEGYDNGNADIENVVPADVNIGQRPMNVYNLMERLLNREIELSPDFQRNRNLWTPEQQSRLIESLMLKIPIPTFYFSASDDDKWKVIDGVQRLSAFENYLVGHINEQDECIKQPLTGLEYMTDFNGLTFDELPRQYVRRIKETPIVVYTVEKGTPDPIVYNIFQRINTGGLHLNSQEIRHALYVGKSTAMLRRLAESEEFLTVTQHSIDTERMTDCEYVNRFVAFTELKLTDYKGNIDGFLRMALKKVNDYDDINILRVERSFRRAMNYCQRIFGRYAFRKYNENWRRGPINKALFESWSYVFSHMTDEEMERLSNKNDILLKRFQKKLQNIDYINALKSGDQYSVVRRIEMTESVVREIL